MCSGALRSKKTRELTSTVRRRLAHRRERDCWVGTGVCNWVIRGRVSTYLGLVGCVVIFSFAHRFYVGAVNVSGWPLSDKGGKITTVREGETVTEQRVHGVMGEAGELPFSPTWHWPWPPPCCGGGGCFCVQICFWLRVMETSWGSQVIYINSTVC